MALVANKTIFNEILQSKIIYPPIPTLPHLGGVMWVEITQKAKPIPSFPSRSSRKIMHFIKTQYT